MNHISPNPKVTAVVTHLINDGYSAEDLCDAVYNAASERAGAINDEGLEAQARYLLQGEDHAWTAEDIMFAAREALKSKQS